MNTQILTLDDINRLYGLGDHPKGKQWSLEESYAYCHKLTYAHYENFPVGSLLIPKQLRPHVHAIYAFARVSDDFSDEEEYEGRRLECLDDWERQLQACYQGDADNPIFIALAHTAETYKLPIELLQGLLIAFKRDVTVNRYETFDSVLEDYCRYSANPVGRLILHLFGYTDEERLQCSDKICTGLQLINFWQDVAIDLKKDRIYIPQEEMRAVGYSEEELFEHTYDERFQKLMFRLGQRTWKLMDDGFPLPDLVKWPLSQELRLTWLGGMEILSRNRKNNYNMFAKRPKLRKWDFIALALRALGRIEGKRKAYQKLFDT